MPLLLAFRRWWAVVFVGLLSLFTLGIVLPDLPAPLRTTIAPEAQWWENAAKRLDPYINDSFPFRGVVLAAHSAYGRWTGGGYSKRVLRGENALFLKEDFAVEQSIGQLVRPDDIANLGEVMADLQRTLAANGTRLVMVVPPNGPTTHFALLPDYVRALARSPTEYDLAAAELKRRGVPFVDLRPIFAEAMKSGPVHWRYDTHWNERGALLAFNAALAAAGRPDLQIDPAKALYPPEKWDGGDLLRLIGETKPKVQDLRYPMREIIQTPKTLTPLPGVMRPVSARDPFPPQAFSTGHEGPRIMVAGDSFTQHLWTGMLAHVSSAFAWTPHRGCRFDLGAVERFKPDIFIYAPTERNMRCKGVPQREP